jgi:lipid-A-disaccharide synthase
MKYFIIAGERSGDLHGGNLVKALKKYDSEAVLQGMGGEYMQSAGVDLKVHYGELAFMGFIEVVKNLSTVSKYIKKIKAQIFEFKPDVIILIDYGGFNMRIAAFAKQNNIKVYYYITPKVWAWYQRRALKLKKNVTKMFVILPFEKEFFKKFDCQVDYVGNPVMDAVKQHVSDNSFLTNYHFDPSKQIVALLPGSRKQELLRMGPVMAEVVKTLPNVNFGVAVVNNLDGSLYEPFRSLPNVSLIPEDTYNLLLNSRAAIVTSGTATLETALFRVPQVVIYKASASTYRIVKFMIKVPFISLVNLIADKEVIRELIQDQANVNDIGEELKKLLKEGEYRTAMLRNYDDIITTLDIGSASDNAAKLMVEYLKSA